MGAVLVPAQANRHVAGPADAGLGKIDFSEFSARSPDGERCHEIGDGAESKVYKAWWYDDAVAIKRMKLKVQDENSVLKLLDEVQLMIGCDHINLVKVLGYISAGLSGLFLVLEFCDRGSLREMLDAEVEAATDQLGNPGSGSAKEGEAPSDPQPGCLPLSVALHGAEGLCAGLLYLHDEKDMIHRDIKSSNVMLTGTRAALVMKLGDFGSAAKDPHVLANASVAERGTSGEAARLAQKGTYRWMAPEMLKPASGGVGLLYDKMCDIWSFGMLLYELLTSRLPFYDIHQGMTVAFRVAMGELCVGTDGFPSLPPHAPAVLDALASKCWAVDPTLRPTAKELLSTIRGCVVELPSWPASAAVVEEAGDTDVAELASNLGAKLAVGALGDVMAPEVPGTLPGAT